MKTLEQFKKELGIEGNIQMMKTKKGRQFAKIGEITIMVSANPDFDKKKPLYVTEVEKDSKGNKLENVYAICNSSLTKGDEF